MPWLLAFALLTPSAARAQSADPWLGRDKALHFGASAAIAAGGYGASALAYPDRAPRLLWGGSLALAAGVGKEVYDLTGRGDPSWRDLTWDVIGTTTGLGLSLLIDLALRGLHPSPAPAR